MTSNASRLAEHRRSEIAIEKEPICPCDRNCFYLLELAGNYKKQLKCIHSTQEFYQAVRFAIQHNFNEIYGISTQNQKINTYLHFLEYDKLITIKLPKDPRGGKHGPIIRIRLNRKNPIVKRIIIPTINYYHRCNSISERNLIAAIVFIVIAATSALFSHSLSDFSVMTACAIGTGGYSYYLHHKYQAVVHQCLCYLHERITNDIPVRIIGTKLRPSSDVQPRPRKSERNQSNMPNKTKREIINWQRQQKHNHQSFISRAYRNVKYNLVPNYRIRIHHLRKLSRQKFSQVNRDAKVSDMTFDTSSRSNYKSERSNQQTNRAKIKPKAESKAKYAKRLHQTSQRPVPITTVFCPLPSGQIQQIPYSEYLSHRHLAKKDYRSNKSISMVKHTRMKRFHARKAPYPKHIVQPTVIYAPTISGNIRGYTFTQIEHRNREIRRQRIKDLIKLRNHLQRVNDHLHAVSASQARQAERSAVNARNATRSVSASTTPVQHQQASFTKTETDRRTAQGSDRFKIPSSIANKFHRNNRLAPWEQF